MFCAASIVEMHFIAPTESVSHIGQQITILLDFVWLIFEVIEYKGKYSAHCYRLFCRFKLLENVFAQQSNTKSDTEEKIKN